MTTEKKLLGVNPVSGEVLPPEAVSFDGDTDYLSRASNFAGDVNSKTVTFSCWVYRPNTEAFYLYRDYNTSANSGMVVFVNSIPNKPRIICWNSSGVSILDVTAPDLLAVDTFFHVLISFDLTNAANRYMYINDVLQSPTWATYTNDFVGFASTPQKYIGSSVNGSGLSKGRLSNLFLDYTYRDLSIESNRRLFIDVDGKPADTDTLSALSPILYLPMKDADTAGSNLGTGGDFTVNGVLATAERGPNQDNCSASEFDGSADSLSSASIGTLVNGSFAVCSCTLKNTTTGKRIFVIGDGTYRTFDVLVYTNEIKVISVNAAGTNIFANVVILPTDIGYEFSVQFSVDTSNYSNFKIAINGVITAYTALVTELVETMPFSTTTAITVGDYGLASAGSSFYNGSIGELYFDTTYMDLATSNPFWDSVANRPNSVRKVIADTGVVPLIALPIDASDAGKNLGTGGDFTVNGGGLTGARGASEYWARSAGVTNGNNLSLTSAVNTGSLTIAGAYKALTNTSNDFFLAFDGSESYIRVDGGGQFDVLFKNSVGTNIVNHQGATGTADTWYTFLLSIDIATASVYIESNGVVNTVATALAGAIDFSTINLGVTSADMVNLSNLYVSTDYTDFSQEANRHKFIDQLGYPKDLTKQIEDGDIPNPLIYMKFDDTAALETNSGTGGDFTVNGTVTAGADFSI
jgi:hypothetical protein